MSNLSAHIASLETIATTMREAAKANKPAGALFNPMPAITEKGIRAMWVEVAKNAISNICCELQDRPTHEIKVTIIGIVSAAKNVGAEIDLKDDLCNAYEALHAALAHGGEGIAAEAITKDIAEALEGYAE